MHMHVMNDQHEDA